MILIYREIGGGGTAINRALGGAPLAAFFSMTGRAHRQMSRGSKPEQLHLGRLGKDAGLVTFVLKYAH